MPYKTIALEKAYQIGMLVERSAKCKVQAEALEQQSQQALLQARQVMREAGLDPNIHRVVTDEMPFEHEILSPGVITENGKPIHLPEEEPKPTSEAVSEEPKPTPEAVSEEPKPTPETVPEEPPVSESLPS